MTPTASPIAAPPGSAGLRAAGSWLAAALVVVIYLGHEWPWPFATVAGVLGLATFACAVAWAVRERRWPAGGPRDWPGWVWAYGLYGVSLAAIYMAAPSAAAGGELARQGLFLAVAAGVATCSAGAAGRAGLVLHFALLGLVLLQIGGPRSGIDHLGRAGFYHALEQWSGYPEIGLLMAMAASGAFALALVLPQPIARLGSLALGGGFAGATLFLQSRSATLTVGVVAIWLVAVVAVRLRGRVAGAAAACLLAGGLWFATAGPGLQPTFARAGAALEREAGIRQAGWAAAMAMTREHPVMGVGLGRYKAEYEARRIGLDSTHAYNIVLHVLAEGGLVGLIGWLALWGRVCWVSLRRSSRSARGAALFAVHAMLVAFLVRSQSEHFLANLETSLRVLLLLACVIGLAEGLASAPEEGADTLPELSAPPRA